MNTEAIYVGDSTALSGDKKIKLPIYQGKTYSLTLMQNMKIRVEKGSPIAVINYDPKEWVLLAPFK